MVRIIPWNLPPVNGGSIGGYTPKVEPTPEPTPVPYNYPYILDDIVITAPTLAVNHGSTRKDQPNGIPAGYYRWFQTEGNKITIGVSGVDIVDTQNVSSVIAKVNVSGSLIQSYYEPSWNGAILASSKTKTTSDLNTDISIDITSIMTPSGGSATNVCNFGGTFETYLGCIKNANAPTGSYYGPDQTGGNAVITTAPTLTLVSITAYNGNGVALQEWTPPEEEEEE